MALDMHGTRLGLYSSIEEAAIVSFDRSHVVPVQFGHGTPLFGHEALRRHDTVDALEAAIVPRRAPMPSFVPNGYELHSLFHLAAGESGALADVMVLFSDKRTGAPDDAALKVYWSRRFATPMLYPKVGAYTLEPESGLAIEAIDKEEVGGFPAIRIVFSALPGAPSLRSRNIPRSFVVWFDERDVALLSVHTAAEPADALTVARSIYHA
jgi:hypothetical protein